MSAKDKPMRILEKDIQRACCEILALDSWRRVRTDMKQLRGMGVQEPGMADDLFIRYPPGVPMECRILAEVLWVEWKKKGGKAADHQTAWHTLERKRGALTLIAGEDFPASIEGFRTWYKTSGLMRKRIIS